MNAPVNQAIEAIEAFTELEKENAKLRECLDAVFSKVNACKLSLEEAKAELNISGDRIKDLLELQWSRTEMLLKTLEEKK